MPPSSAGLRIATWSGIPHRRPTYALAAGVDLVVIRDGDKLSVLYGRCVHRGSLLADGFLRGDDLVCGVHNYDYRWETGVSAYENHDVLQKFTAWVDPETDAVLVDEDEIAAWAREHPQPYDRTAYQGLYADIHGGAEEPLNGYIHGLARDGLAGLGHQGAITSMGVPRAELPRWDDLQLLTGQLSRRPLADDAAVGTDVVIGPRAARPLHLRIPILVTDMSYGALSREAKIALATGAEAAGTGICSGEGGMLPEEQAANSRYLYELATGRFGWDLDRAASCQALHFKVGQAAKTGAGGLLPGAKVSAEIAAVRGLAPGQDAISPAVFPDLQTPGDFARLAQDVREASGGIPIGFKMSAQHIEADLDFVLAAGADYVILDGRGGGTGAAPEIFRDHIGVPTMPALARARRHLDDCGRDDVTLVVTGGLRRETDIVKALALGADAVALGNSAMHAIGCLAMRACHTNNCPVGIATQQDHLRARIEVQRSARQLTTFLEATVALMQVLARACGHSHLRDFTPDDLTTWKREVADLTGVAYAGAGS